SFGEKVLVILLDEAVMEQFPCRSPVPRGMLARLIQITSDSGAKLIGLDIFLKNLTSGDEDRELSLSIKKSGRVVLVSALREKDGGLRLDMPSDRSLDAALATGLAILPINPMDQRVRELQAYQKVEVQIVPALSTSLFLIEHGGESLPSEHVNMDTFSEKWLQMKLNARRRIFINFHWSPSTAAVEKNVLRTLPDSAVLTGLVQKEWFQDQIVLIGAGFPDNLDAYRTPFYSSRFNYALMPGIEIHANSLATILSGKTIPSLNPISSLAILLFFFFLVTIERRFNTMIRSRRGGDGPPG
ncbi:MAG: CHASE2 domain-containing protein, partial [Desulfatiglandales bacterium]|nr:CHASE2 domain-containing protein [Desulfatiglandales bacterium]